MSGLNASPVGNGTHYGSGSFQEYKAPGLAVNENGQVTAFPTIQSASGILPEYSSIQPIASPTTPILSGASNPVIALDGLGPQLTPASATSTVPPIAASTSLLSSGMILPLLVGFAVFLIFRKKSAA